MANANRAAVRSGVIVAPGVVRRRSRPLVARRLVIGERLERGSRAPDLAPVVTDDLVRTIAAVAIAITVCLSLTDVIDVAFLRTARPGEFRAAMLALAVTVPLHVRHLVYGVRGERPPAGIWTLGLLAIVTIAGPRFAGEVWIREFTPLAVSILIILPARLAFPLVGAVVLAPLWLVGTQWVDSPAHPLAGTYLAFLIAWRTVTQFVPLRLLAALRVLDSATRELEARGVVQARIGIDEDLRKSVRPALQRIIARGEAARVTATDNPASASAELRQLVVESRRGLADARRIVAGYRTSSIGAELDAAAALLGASGANVRIVVADGISLDSPNEDARDAIHAAVSATLRDEPSANYQILIARDTVGRLHVDVIYVAGDSEKAI